jgi:23S rRNA pseudouridine1911/1915/1917 synthase
MPNKGLGAAWQGEAEASLPEVRQRYTVSEQQAGQRLDRIIASFLSITRSQAKVLIDQAHVSVNGVRKKAGYVVRANEQLSALPLPEAPTIAVPQAIPLDIVYEDESLVAINKPAGLVVHPAPGQWRGTVVNALLFRWGWTDSGSSLRPGIVHRLDKDTSGVMLVAKNQRVCEQLARQFQARQIHKTYCAVVVGHLAAPAGEIAFPIGRHPTERKKMSVHARHSRSALSRYQVVAESQGVSFVRLFPETGRTHQLRVHMAAFGHPLVGDGVYGLPASKLGNAPGIVQGFSRQALHAEAIRFCHPVREEMMTLRAPYPADLVALLAALGISAEGENGHVLN